MLSQETLLAQCGSRWDKTTGAVSMPIYQTAIFSHPGLGKSTGFDYSRSGNPTRNELEATLAKLELGAGASVFASGLAAIDAVLHLFKPNDAIVMTEDMYGGTIRLANDLYAHYGLKFIYIDTSKQDQVEEALSCTSVKGIFIENPTNPLLKLCDIKRVCSLAKRHKALSIVDNTFLTPVCMRPLELGADIVVHSATKYLCGHNDVIAGAVISKTKELADKIQFFQNAAGAIISPFDSWLLLRSLKTLHVRIKRQQENALKVATFLEKHPAIEEVHYPGLKSDPAHMLMEKQSSGFGAMISIRLKDETLVPKILESIKVFLFAESLGGTESLITFPATQTHADIPLEERKRLGIDNKLLRISIGLEDPDDLIKDLANVLK